MKKTNLLTATIISLTLITVGCGKAGTQSSTSNGALDTCMLSPATCGSNSTIDSKVADANSALNDTHSALSKLSAVDLFANPSALTSNGALNGISAKLKSLIDYINGLETQLNASIAGLDPVVNAQLIAQVQSSIAKLEKIKSDIFAARDALVAKVDAFISMVQTKISQLNPVLQIVLFVATQKVMTFLENFRNAIAALGT